MTKAPALFIGHGSPMNALEDNAFTRAWRSLPQRFEKPRAVLVVSAHWVTKGARTTANTAPKTIHDFFGFPQSLFDVRYPAPGDPALAADAARLLAPFEGALDEGWGLDHGAWSVLVHLFPEGDVPVVQASLPQRLDGAGLYAMGRALAPLRAQGVAVLGSGNVVHNLAHWRDGDVAPWVPAFDAFIADAVAARADAAVIAYKDHPLAATAAPDWDHFAPLLVTLGAAAPEERAQIFNQSYIPGISMTSFAFGLAP